MARLTSTGILFDLANSANSINSFYWLYPAGTKKFFFQANAPTGWTKDATHNNKALRVVSGTGGGSGGATNFTTVLSSTSGNLVTSVNDTFDVNIASGQGTNVGPHTLSLSQLPDHSHPSIFGPTSGSGATPFSNAGARTVSGSNATGGMIEGTGGGSHTHPFSGSVTINSSSQTGINLAVTYVDVILCSLN